jgi:hypothetical protein
MVKQKDKCKTTYLIIGVKNYNPNDMPNNLLKNLQVVFEESEKINNFVRKEILRR